MQTRRLWRRAAAAAALAGAILVCVSALRWTSNKPRENAVAAAETAAAETPKPLYVEHVMKAGGSCLCHLLNPGSERSNCRLDARDPEKALFAARVDPEFVRDWFRSHPAYANVVFSEPGWAHRDAATFGDMGRFASLEGSFWDSYRTMLLIRDPVDRYLSDLAMRIVEGPFCLGQNKRARCISYGDGRGFWSRAADDEFGLLRRNFLTQHLVPGFRNNHTVGACSKDVLDHAKRVVDRFDFVLDVEDARRLLDFGGNCDPRRIMANGTNENYTAAALSSRLLAFLRSENDCDLPLWQYARAKSRTQSEQGTIVSMIAPASPGRDNRNK